jgi:hypothetical protein
MRRRMAAIAIKAIRQDEREDSGGQDEREDQDLLRMRRKSFFIARP